MLQVKRTSWHYKAYSSWFYSRPQNLCQYFRSVLTAMFLTCLKVLTSPVVLVVRAVGWVFNKIPAPSPAITEPVVNKMQVGWSYLRVPMIILASFGWAIGVFAFCLFAIDPAAVDYIRSVVFMTFMLGVILGVAFGAMTYLEEGSFSGPGRKNDLFWEWVLAKKQKVCPLIELVD